MLEEIRADLLKVADPQEKEHRAVVLTALEKKISRDGIHQAQAHDSRARQFMPFAALKGYADMIQQEERATPND